MPLFHATGLNLSFGITPLLEEAAMSLEEGERVCLVGRNGQGKTSLMKVLAGQLEADSGVLHFEPHIRVSYLPQAIPGDLTGPLLDVVLAGREASAALLDEYETLSPGLGDPPRPAELERLQFLQEELDRRDGWGVREAAEAALQRLGLDSETCFEDLSGGRKRQCLLVRALLSRPGILLLDEPTNHLDLAAITWLEDLIRGFSGAVLFVTHDRAFLRAMATRILDLDRGDLTSWPGDYDLYRRRKQEHLDAEVKSWSEFDKHLAREETWIRQGIKARRTRNEGRVRALKRLREERKLRRERMGSAKITLQESERSGARVIEVNGLSFAWPDKPIVEGFDIELQRGDRLGIIGPNGCGKTTLLRLMLGEIPPQSGTVRLGTKLHPLYFDQLRGQLDDAKTVQENVCEDGDTVVLNGKPRHVIGYLGDFLFSPERARSPVSILSGGERNRLLLARLFVQKANLLILDEPTNDLDTETLELLEATLLGYEGTLILVSHDREFLNNVVTSCIAFDGDGQVRHYAGGYDDWLQQRPEQPAEVKAPREATGPTQGAPQDRAPQKRTRLSFKERKELEELPGRIETLELEQTTLNERIGQPTFFAGPHDEVSQVTDRLAAIESELLQLLEAWEQLETRREELEG
ncbi:MAG: ATP-binding cassette domain-containing protein [Myxococcota bacterium]|nr:ATP-binding cassette domain-containing protein [Myxococcota bacterium]